MTLLLDVGNTALKWAQSEGEQLGHAQVELHRGRADGLEQRLVRAWQNLAWTDPALGCSVAAAEVRKAVERAARTHGGSICWLAAQDRYDGAFVLQNGYRAPGQLGADRWHGMLGACERRPRQSLVLVAAGTAMTIDCVDWRGGVALFIGGCIAPGTQLMLESLAQRTGGLPHARGDWVEFPDNTDDAIATGVADAQTGLALRVVERARRHFGSAPQVIVSGGDADALAERLSAGGVALAIEHNLVLGGLALRARTTDQGLHR